MRGAQPDAECPRCGHVQPPADALVTCARCGLSFVPKEIQHKLRRRTELPALVPPRSLTVDEDGDRLVISWPDNQRAGYLAIFAALATSPIVFLSLLGTTAKVGYLIFLAALAFSGRRMSRPRPRLWIDRDHFGNPLESHMFAAIGDISIEGDRVLAHLRDGAGTLEIHLRDPDTAAYVADVLTRRRDQLPPQE